MGWCQFPSHHERSWSCQRGRTQNRAPSKIHNTVECAGCDFRCNSSLHPYCTKWTRRATPQTRATRENESGFRATQWEWFPRHTMPIDSWTSRLNSSLVRSRGAPSATYTPAARTSVAFMIGRQNHLVVKKLRKLRTHMWNVWKSQWQESFSQKHNHWEIRIWFQLDNPLPSKKHRGPIKDPHKKQRLSD